MILLNPLLVILVLIEVHLNCIFPSHSFFSPYFLPYFVSNILAWHVIIRLWFTLSNTGMIHSLKEWVTPEFLRMVVIIWIQFQVAFVTLTLSFWKSEMACTQYLGIYDVCTKALNFHANVSMWVWGHGWKFQGLFLNSGFLGRILQIIIAFLIEWQFI